MRGRNDVSISEKQVRRPNSLVNAVLTLGPQVWILVSAVVISSLLGMVFVSSPPSALLSTMIVGGAAGIGAMIYSIVRFERFVLVLLAIRPLMDAFNLGGQGGVLTPSVAIGVAFEISAVFWLWRRWRDRRMVPWSPAAFGLTTLVCAAAASCLVSTMPIVSITATARLTAAALMFIVLEQGLATNAFTVRQVTYAVAISAAYVTIFALLQGITKTGFDDVGAGITRVHFPFVHSNVLAKYLDVVIVMGVGYALFGPHRWRKQITVGIVAASIALILTYARVGWATAAVASLYLLWYRSRRAVPMVVLAGLTVVMTVPAVYLRIAELWTAKPSPTPGMPDNSMIWRVEYWQQLIPLARMSPFNGIGYEMSMHVGGQDLMAHNVWVQTYVEMGVFGIVGLVAAFAGVGVTVIQAVRRVPARRRPAALHIAAAVCLSLAMMMTTENLLDETTTLWYAAAALTCGYAVNRSRPLSSTDPPPIIGPSPMSVGSES